MTAPTLRSPEAQETFRSFAADVGGRCGLRPHSAAAGSGGAEARLPQPPCLAAAALAGRRADPARDHGRRRRDRRRPDADGGRPRHRTGGARNPRRRSGPTTRPANSRRASPRSARGWSPSPCPNSPPAGLVFRPQSQPKARPTRTRSTRARRRSTGAKAPSRSATASTACRRRPARYGEIAIGGKPERIKILRAEVVDRAAARPGRSSKRR